MMHELLCQFYLRLMQQVCLSAAMKCPSNTPPRPAHNWKSYWKQLSACILLPLLSAQTSFAFEAIDATTQTTRPSSEVSEQLELQEVVDAAYAKYKDLEEGANADYIPILATVPSDLFGVVIATKNGQVFSAGDIDYKFSIQSVSKPFTAALIMQQMGPQALLDKIGVEPTGLPFNSKMALELYEQRSANPLVNAGAIAAVSLIQADSESDRWAQIKENLEDFAGTQLSLLDEVYQSEYETAWSNRGHRPW